MKTSNRQRNISKRHVRGSALVEGAMTMTVLLMMLFGILEFGRAVWIYNSLANVSREAARYAMVHGESSKAPATTDDVAKIAKYYAVGMDSSQLNVAVAWLPNNKAGSDVKVTISYPVFPMAALAIRSQLNLSSASRVMIAQ